MKKNLSTSSMITYPDTNHTRRYLTAVLRNDNLVKIKLRNIFLFNIVSTNRVY